MMLPLRCETRSAAQMAALCAADEPQHHVLGGALFGATAHIATPLQTLALPQLRASSTIAGELWLSSTPCRQGEYEGIRHACDGRVLYGVIEIDEAAFADENAHALSRATEAAYRRIFALLDREGYPYLWRTWNYLAAINAEAQGLERYRQFNIGRHQAFAARDRLKRESMPAACALGFPAADLPLSIAFLAGRTPPVAIENPRQMAAYDYPADYGPRSPAFARAVLAQLPGQQLLFVSGTASILGHATVHRGDMAAQMRESLANIAAVVAEADRVSALPATWRDAAPAYRVYVRHAADYATAQAILQEVAGSETTAIYLQADICRADLLVEVETFATRPATATGN